MSRYIVWTSREHGGVYHPSCSLATVASVREGEEKAIAWQEYVHSHYPARRAGHCVVTTYGDQRLVASIP